MSRIGCRSSPYRVCLLAHSISCRLPGMPSGKRMQDNVRNSQLRAQLPDLTGFHINR